MKSRFLMLAGLCLLIGLAAVWFFNNYANSTVTLPAASESELRRNIEQPPEMPPETIDPSRRVRLAIGSLGLGNDSSNGQLADLITVEISSEPSLQLVERQDLEKILREISLSLSGLVRAKDVIKVGKLLKADWFLLGTLSTNGDGNAIVARVVDARTGIMRDVAVFPYKEPSQQLAAKLAAFAKNCRREATNSKPREYLAFGTFQDLGVNNRQANLPSQLRSRLVSAYQNSGVSLLEREYVDILLNETRLDLAGLVENSTNEIPSGLQPAIWLVTGYYQSYERAGYQIEMGLQVQRIFGRATNIFLRASSSEELFNQIKRETDTALHANPHLLAPTRLSEARYQMEVGKELLKGPSRSRFMPDELWLISAQAVSTWDQQGSPIEKRNVQEAIRAFETVLLLSPTNREAQLYMAACYRNQLVWEPMEACELYRKVIDEGIHDRWNSVAEQALEMTFSYWPSANKSAWWETAALHATNDSAREFYLNHAKIAKRDEAIESAQATNSNPLAEQRLYDHLRDFDKRITYAPDLFTGQFIDAYGTNREAALRRLNELVPEMRAAASNSIPYLLATLVTLQEDTNSPIVSEFKETMAHLSVHPKEIPKQTTPFWSHVRNTTYDWALQKSNYEFCVEILLNKMGAESNHDEVTFPSSLDEDRMALAFNYLSLQKWQNAMNIFQIWSNRPVYMGNSGPWGEAFTVVRTKRSVEYCQKKLGLPIMTDSREFNLEYTGVHFYMPTGYGNEVRGNGTFEDGADGLWIASTARLTKVTYDLKTNLVVDLPLSPFTEITSIQVGISNIWIGTSGEGLVQYDKATHSCRLWTEKDGLLMDFISSLELTEDVLWIGYGKAVNGGLGQMDLNSRSIRSFSASLDRNIKARQGAPRSVVSSMAAGSDRDEVWMTAKDLPVIRFRVSEDTWESSTNSPGVCVIARYQNDLFVGGYVYDNPPASGLGVSTWNLKDGSRREFPFLPGFPQYGVTCITPVGERLWVGGMGYVALLDPARNKMLQYSYLKWPRVDTIREAGGFVWVQFGKNLFRAAIKEPL